MLCNCIVEIKLSIVEILSFWRLQDIYTTKPVIIKFALKPFIKFVAIQLI